MTITRTTDRTGVSTIVMDDGRVSALDVDMLREPDAAFDACMEDAAIVVADRSGMHSAGLDMRLVPALDRPGLTEPAVAFARAEHRIWLGRAPA